MADVSKTRGGGLLRKSNERTGSEKSMKKYEVHGYNFPGVPHSGPKKYEIYGYNFPKGSHSDILSRPPAQILRN